MKTTVDESGRTQWHFSKAELQALLAFMSTDETRHTMCCLAFDQENGRVWATDGHRGVILRGPRWAAVNRPVEAMRRSDVESIVANHGMKDEILILGPGAASGFFQERGLDISCMADKPNNLPVVYPAAVKEFKKGVTAGFNGGYIADLAMITRACPPLVTKGFRGKVEKHYPGLEIQPPTDPLSPMLVTVNCPANASQWSAVVMPMRL